MKKARPVPITPPPPWDAAPEPTPAQPVRLPAGFRPLGPFAEYCQNTELYRAVSVPAALTSPDILQRILSDCPASLVVGTTAQPHHRVLADFVMARCHQPAVLSHDGRHIVTAGGATPLPAWAVAFEAACTDLGDRRVITAGTARGILSLGSLAQAA